MTTRKQKKPYVALPEDTHVRRCVRCAELLLVALILADEIRGGGLRLR